MNVLRTLNCVLLICVFLLALEHADASPLRLVDFPETQLGKNGDYKTYGDVNRSSGEIDNNPAFLSVTNTYGYSIITARQFPVKSGSLQANLIPWSSWWYPKKEEYLFDNSQGLNSSPLSKYDLVRQKKYGSANRPRPNSAAEWERAAYNPRSLAWEGLCDAWAMASISKPEPKRPVSYTIDGTTISFSVGDLKALLLKTYEAVDDSAVKVYGQKFTGDFNGWVFPDIFPEQFHRFVEIQLGQKKQAFVMDHDPGVEVWNVPVFKTNYTIDKMSDDPNAVFVRTWLYSAESVKTNEKNLVGTEVVVREYDYVLQGIRNDAGDLVIKSGYWVKGPDGIDSRKDHPDYLIQLDNPASLQRKSWNPEIEVSVVDEILSKSY